MTDLEVIREFYQQIGWQDECLEIQESDRTLIKIMRDNGRTQ